MCGRGTLTKEDSRVPQRSQNGGAVLARRGHRDCDSRLLKLFREHFGTGCRTDAFFQLLSKQLRPAITGVWTVSASSPSCSDPSGSCMPQRGERTPNAVIARTPIDIREVVGMDIKRLKGSTVLFRPPLEKRIEDCFPCGGMNPCRIGQEQDRRSPRRNRADLSSLMPRPALRFSRWVSKARYDVRRAPPLWDIAPHARYPLGSLHAGLPTFLSRRGP